MRAASGHLRSGRSGLPCPINGHRSKWSEGVRCRWATPQTTEQSRYDDILLKRRQAAKCCTAFAPLKKHGIESGIRVEQAHRWVTVPEAEALKFVRPFHVRHAEFEHSARAITADDRCYPGAAHLVSVEGVSE
jgi:hypothetical protein